MSVVPALTDEQWTMLLDHAAEIYNEVTLSRGFHYFKQGRVATLFVSEDGVVQARVEGTEPYQATLHLQKLRNSRCTCPVGTACKHLAAVMMELADRLGYSPTQIVNARQLPKRSAFSRSETDFKQLPNMKVLEWHSFFDSYASPIRMSYDPRLFVDMQRHNFQKLNKAKGLFPINDWIHFELHQELFLLQKLKENLQSGNGYYTSSAILQVCDEIQAWIRKKGPQFLYLPFDERLQETLAYLRDQLTLETDSKYLYYGITAELWKEWVLPAENVEAWANTELEEMDKLTPLTPSLAAAKAFLLLLQSQSEKAWETLQTGGSLHAAPLQLFASFLNHLRDTGDWAGLIAWLERTTDFYYGKRSSDIRAYINYWQQACEHLPEAEESMWAILEEMLPHSLRMIEDLLYEQKKWKPWIELQIVQGYDPLSHRVAVLQPIEKEQAELLLPYYHQAIEHYVGLKTRQDYKSAVKLLKRLEKVYKKLKRTDRWASFLGGFAAKYNRLRALQEELKKGKLLA